MGRDNLLAQTTCGFIFMGGQCQNETQPNIKEEEIYLNKSPYFVAEVATKG